MYARVCPGMPGALPRQLVATGKICLLTQRAVEEALLLHSPQRRAEARVQCKLMSSLQCLWVRAAVPVRSRRAEAFRVHRSPADLC